MSRRWFSAFLAVVVVALLPDQKAHGEDRLTDRALAQAIAGAQAPLDPLLTALADGRLEREVEPPAPGATTLSPVPLGFALTGDQLSPLEITASPAGERELQDFLGRLADHGVDAKGLDFVVYTLPSVQAARDAAERIGAVPDLLDSSLILPRGTPVELVAAFWDGRQLLVKTTVAASGEDSQFRALSAPSGSMQWQRGGGLGCLGRKQNSTAHYDPCQWFYRMQNDRDSGRDYWASEMYGTGKGHSVWTLNSLEVDSRRKDGSPAQEWVDWDPGADANTNCHSQTVSVSYAGVGLALDKQHCEMWDIDKGSEAADMSNWWRGHIRRKERETAAMTITRTASGQAPTLLLDFDYYANP